MKAKKTNGKKFGLYGASFGFIVTLTAPGMVSAQIEEVLVTAEKREQDIFDVGSTISVMSSDQIMRQRITSMADIAAAIPSLEHARSVGNSPIYTLRGIGFNESSLGVYPATSVYLDQAPLTFPVLASHAAFDLQRIEVLKGPQGTLYGQNSTGGAVNYIANKPTEEFEAGINATYGRFDLTEVGGHISGPLTDTLNGRLAFKTRHMDAWQSSITRDAENGEEEYYTVRGILDWSPTDEVRVSLNINGWKDESEPQALQLAGTEVSVPSFIGQTVVNAPLSPREPRAADWGPLSPESDRDLFQTILRVEYDITPDLMLTSLSSFIDFEQEQVIDRDAIFGENNDFGQMDATAETFTQELRLENITNLDQYRWVVGFNYEDSSVEEDQIIIYEDNSVANANAIEENGIYSNNDMKNWAVFANLDYQLTEKLNFKIGARYTDSELETIGCPYDSGNGAVAGLFNFLGGLLSDGNFDPVGTGFGECFTLNFEGKPGETFNDTLEEESVSWRVGLDYDVSEDVLFYGNVSKGFKQGNFPTLTASTWRELQSVTEESVLSYEVGAKARLLDRRLHISSAAFYYEYEDKQVRGNISDPVFNILEVLRNIPESEVLGAEVEVEYSPIDGLNLSLGAVYLDHEITKQPAEAIDILGRPADFEGAGLPFTADFSANLGAEYRWEVGQIEPFVGFTYRYTDEKSTAIAGENVMVSDIPENRTMAGGSNPFMIDSFWTLDLRAGVSSLDDTWTVFVWGKNVTDEYYWTNVNVAEDTIGRLAGMPATYGVTFNYNF